MKEKEFLMITLSIQNGREKKAEVELKKFLKTNALYDAQVFYDNNKKLHYHVITKDTVKEINGTKEWPGCINKNIVTESWANQIKETHKLYVMQEETACNKADTPQP